MFLNTNRPPLSHDTPAIILESNADFSATVVKERGTFFSSIKWPSIVPLETDCAAALNEEIKKEISRKALEINF